MNSTQSEATLTTAASVDATRVGTGDESKWWFLGLLVEQLSAAGSELVVAEATVPEGASPPFHMHKDLDDSFYVLEGRIVVRCGDEVSLATAGTWVPFPKLVPHTFRVMDGAARVLMVHENDSFMQFVRDIGSPATGTEVPTASEAPSFDDLNRSMKSHGISTVGPSMSEDDARGWLAELT